jgi:PAS domain-containing protein
MKTVCTFCSCVVNEGISPGDPVSHGVCPDCYDRILSEYGFDVKKFLDQLEHPVILVDADVRVLAANSLALDLLGKPAASVRGTLCGEVLECINASCEGGCGKTDLCPDCAFRASVSETCTTGLPVNRRAAILVRKDGDTLRDVPFLISTRKDGNVVMLQLEPVKRA